MNPLPGEAAGTPRFLYNEALCKSRNCIERAFGVMKATWRCLSKHRSLQYNPTFSGMIVNACTVLHNIRSQYDNNTLEDELICEPHSQQNQFFPNSERLSIGRRVQNQIIEQYFS